MKRYIAHGMTLIAWMVDFETGETEPKIIWNEAAGSLHDTDSKVMEQTNRILNVHPDDERCGICPQPVPPAPPLPPEKKKAGDDLKDE